MEQRLRIVSGQVHQQHDTMHPLGLLRVRRKRSRCGAADDRNEFPRRTSPINVGPQRRVSACQREERTTCGACATQRAPTVVKSCTEQIIDANHYAVEL